MDDLFSFRVVSLMRMKKKSPPSTTIASTICHVSASAEHEENSSDSFGSLRTVPGSSQSVR